jgi:hypothetical protein
MTNEDVSRHLFIVRMSSFLRHLGFAHYPFFHTRRPVQIFSDKICCDLPKARLVASKFLKIVLGGTAALHAYRVWGAVIFLAEIRMMSDKKISATGEQIRPFAQSSFVICH